MRRIQGGKEGNRTVTNLCQDFYVRTSLFRTFLNRMSTVRSKMKWETVNLDRVQMIAQVPCL